MSFDLDLTLKEMTAAARATISRQSKKTGEALRRVLDDQKDALRQITATRIAGEIDDAELERQLANTRLVFEAGMSMVRAVSKASIQKALDAAFDVLARAIGRAVAGPSRSRLARSPGRAARPARGRAPSPSRWRG